MRAWRALRLLVLAAAAALGLAGCGGSPQRPSVPAAPPVGEAIEAPPAPAVFAPSLIAAAKVPSVPVFDSPSSATPVRSLAHPTPEQYPLAFRVDERQGDWLRVFLPVRPNGSKGWVRASDVSLTSTTYRVVVELSAHRLRLYDGATLVMEELVAVGMPRFPTPLGDFYVDAIVPVPNPSGPYGPYQMSVAGFSNVLTRFAGGPGQIALHGTNRPGALGTDVSHGCVRLRNEAVTRLASTVPLGTPVQILA